MLCSIVPKVRRLLSSALPPTSEPAPVIADIRGMGRYIGRRRHVTRRSKLSLRTVQRCCLQLWWRIARQKRCRWHARRVPGGHGMGSPLESQPCTPLPRLFSLSQRNLGLNSSAPSSQPCRAFSFSPPITMTSGQRSHSHAGYGLIALRGQVLGC